MMENRSFDHFLGHLKSQNPAINGLDGTQGNPVNPAVPNSPFVPVNNDAVDGGPVDPCHSFECIVQQVYGFAKPVANRTAPVRMNGFASIAPGGAKNIPFVMSAFNSTNLPVLSSLAMEYAVFDAWFPSAPTCTNPNREFMMSGTSHGMLDNSFPDAGFPQETHFAFLERHNVSWVRCAPRTAAGLQRARAHRALLLACSARARAPCTAADLPPVNPLPPPPPLNRNRTTATAPG